MPCGRQWSPLLLVTLVCLGEMLGFKHSERQALDNVPVWRNRPLVALVRDPRPNLRPDPRAPRPLVGLPVQQDPLLLRLESLFRLLLFLMNPLPVMFLRLKRLPRKPLRLAADPFVAAELLRLHRASLMRSMLLPPGVN